MEEATSYIATINWANPSWDLFIVLFFVVVALLYGLSMGRDRLIVLLVGIYMSLAVVNTAPFIHNASATEVGIDQLFAFKIGTFLGAFVLFFFLISRSALANTIGKNDSAGRWWHTIIFSFLQVGLLISVILSYLPREAIDHFAPLTRSLFTGDLPQFLWIVGPIVAMMLIRTDKDE